MQACKTKISAKFIVAGTRSNGTVAMLLCSYASVELSFLLWAEFHILRGVWFCQF